MEHEARQLAEALGPHLAGSILVVTGAGISHASGIATFRGSDPGAVWRHHDLEMATFATFERDPVLQWSWYLERFRAVDGALPNPGHRALAELEHLASERGGRLTLVTQNIDTLHEAAGSRDVIKIHGSSDRLRCARPGCRFGAPDGSVPRRPDHFAAFRAAPGRATLPTCEACGGLLRAHVLFFDEYYQEHRDYRFEEALEASEAADLVLFVGTSFSVGITEILLRTARRRQVPAYSIDPAAPPADASPEVTRLAQPAEELLPAVLRGLASPVHD
jgi:NAD-dependent deacetylase